MKEYGKAETNDGNQNRENKWKIRSCLFFLVCPFFVCSVFSFVVCKWMMFQMPSKYPLNPPYSFPCGFSMRWPLKYNDQTRAKWQSNPTFKLVNWLFFLINLSGFSWFLVKICSYIQFLQGIRIWGQKMSNFRARREKLRKTNVKLKFHIFYFSKFDFFQIWT